MSNGTDTQTFGSADTIQRKLGLKGNKSNIQRLKKIEIQPMTETNSADPEILIPGYGRVRHSQAVREAQLASEVAYQHGSRGEHYKAHLQHERASMFHKALADYQKKQHNEEVIMTEEVQTPKTLQELEAYKHRLEVDIRRSRIVDMDGLTNNTPLIRNYKNVQEEIRKLKNK